MDIIHLLPDSVANQIAAGEVVQRPASAVKELIENSIDAGARNIQLIVKDAGRTLVQVIDDGKGMSPSDARMAFEKHATSKIKSINDLFSLATMGFRGEALASIAAVAQVELTTRQEGDEMGTHICNNGGKVESQEFCTCPVGTNISMKNLFYNIPARRNFLKSNAAEFNAIDSCFKNIALVYPGVAFELIHNDQKCHVLPAASLRERIIHLFGKQINNQLYSINAESSLAKIYGFVGSPETAKQKNDKQYFFVNGRYMKHPYFQKAVSLAYDKLIAPNTKPTFFIYLEVDPKTIDVNVHPTKTEIKFENEQELFPIIQSCTREGLGRCNVQGTIDFDTENMVDIPSLLERPKDPAKPVIHSDRSFNPFNSGAGGKAGPAAERNARNWGSLFEGFESEKRTATLPDTSGFDDEEKDNADEEELPGFDIDCNQPDTTDDMLISQTQTYRQTNMFFGNESTVNERLHLVGNEFLQFQNRYIFTQVKSGLMCIDQHRAHFRILFDRYLANLKSNKCASQRLLYPEQFDLSASESMILEEIADDLADLGYDISNLGNNTYMVNGVPVNNGDREAKPFITDIIEAVKGQEHGVKEERLRTMASAQARMAAIRSGQKLQAAEINQLINDLFSCAEHTLTPDNKPIITIIGDEEINKRFR